MRRGCLEQPVLAALLAVLFVGCGLFGGGGGGGGGGSSHPKPKPNPPPVVTIPSVPATPIEVLGLGTHSMEVQARGELRDLGVEYVRHTLYAPLWSHPSYPISWGLQMDSMQAAGFRMLIVVHPLPDGWTPAQFGALMGEVARRFPEVDAWQIGNEEMFSGTVDAHAEYHRAAYAAIKAADPDALVVSMAWTYEADARTFARLAPFDALAVHTYGFPVWATVKNWAPLARDYPVWITELGFQPPQLPPGWSGDWEQEQARQIRGAVNQAGASGFDRVYIYQLRTGENVELHGIIRDKDGSLRPAALWLRPALHQRLAAEEKQP